ncbi:hypothetical protein KM043_004978 [Ampulex compressa]|nr:hypothetical protein KM043_004978 [Ampulex compressa]
MARSLPNHGFNEPRCSRSTETERSDGRIPMRNQISIPVAPPARLTSQRNPDAELLFSAFGLSMQLARRRRWCSRRCQTHSEIAPWTTYAPDALQRETRRDPAEDRRSAPNDIVRSLLDSSIALPPS